MAVRFSSLRAVENLIIHLCSPHLHLSYPQACINNRLYELLFKIFVILLFSGVRNRYLLVILLAEEIPCSCIPIKKHSVKVNLFVPNNGIYNSLNICENSHFAKSLNL